MKAENSDRLRQVRASTSSTPLVDWRTRSNEETDVFPGVYRLVPHPVLLLAVSGKWKGSRECPTHLPTLLDCSELILSILIPPCYVIKYLASPLPSPLHSPMVSAAVSSKTDTHPQRISALLGSPTAIDSPSILSRNPRTMQIARPQATGLGGRRLPAPPRPCSRFDCRQEEHRIAHRARGPSSHLFVVAQSHS